MSNVVTVVYQEVLPNGTKTVPQFLPLNMDSKDWAETFFTTLVGDFSTPIHYKQHSDDGKFLEFSAGRGRIILGPGGREILLDMVKMFLQPGRAS